MKPIFYSLLAALLLAGCQSTMPAPKALATTEPTVVMISLDGFRWDYIEKHGAPNLAAIAKNGVRAEQMRPVYPTKTFPNHLSLITGLYPVHHGIVDNHFCDKDRWQCYDLGDGKADSTWLHGVPLWNLARMNGVKSAAYFWPESDARIGGMTPNYYYHYSQKSDYHQRVKQIIAWLNMPTATRPHFIAGYFSLVDTMGHRFGPDSAETAKAVHYVDSIIGELRDGIRDKVKQPVNLIVVADHGMTNIDPAQAIDYRQLPVSKDFKVVNASTRLLLYAKPGTDAAAIARQKAALKGDDRFVVRTEAELAARHYTGSPRVADIILETTAPRYFTDKVLKDRHGHGNHGYSYFKDMGALFVAEGPAFKKGVMLKPFDNIDVYPLVARILHLPLAGPIDGTITPLLPALKN